jgi:hypothetical protein
MSVAAVSVDAGADSDDADAVDLLTPSPSETMTSSQMLLRRKSEVSSLGCYDLAGTPSAPRAVSARKDSIGRIDLMRE